MKNIFQKLLASLLIMALMWPAGFNGVLAADDLASMPGDARQLLGAVTMADGKVMVIGGNNGINHLTSTLIYDPATNTWSSGTSLPKPIFSHAVTLLKDGRILVAGGNSFSNGVSSDVFIYNPSTSTWNSAASLLTARASAAAATLPDGKVLVVGGGNDEGDLQSTEIYDPINDTWSAGPDLPGTRKETSASPLGDGRVLVAGGTVNGMMSESALIYDPVLNSWSAAANMPSQRYVHASTSLLDGRVALNGGLNSNYEMPTSTAIYDPETNEWNIGTTTNVGRVGHAAVLLPNGKVFVIGGSGVSGPVRSSESHTQTPRTPRPTANVSSGEISPGTNVTLSSIVTGLNIHYTTDGSTPTLASPIYTGPIPVNESMTIKAIAHHASWGISRMLSVDYTISVPRAAKPTASPASGAVAFGTMVALTTETEDAVIHYTTDGSTPTVSSSVYSFVYSTPISITGAMTIKAIAVKAGILDSAEMTEAYIVLPQAAAPTAAPAGGAVASGTTVALTTETEDAAIYYTTDGSTPTESSPVYSAPIIITSATTIKAITVKSGMINSTEMTESYTLMSQVATPTASPSGDAVASGTLVALTTETEDTTIHYTTDGSTPTTSSPVYSAPLSITSAMTIKAIAVKVGMIDSAEMTESYTVLPQAAAPTAAPAGSAVSSGTTVALTTVTEDAAIHYTTDGSTPTESSPVYSAPIIITSATTIKAIAVKAGMTNSAVMSASYTIAAPPTGSTPTPSAPTQVQPTDASVLVNGKVEYAGTAITAQKDGRSITTIVIDQQKLEQRLAAVGARAVITISANAAANVVAGELTGQMVKNMESKQAVVEIKTDAATYSLPARQIDIDAVSAAIGSNVNLQEIKVTIEIAEPKSETVKVVNQAASMGNFTLVVPALEFNVRATYNSQTVEVSRFNAYVERTVAIPEGIDPSKITTGVVVEADGTVRHVPTKVIQIDGKYYAKINSLTNSVYSVVWHPLEFSDAANHWAREAVNDMGSRMVVNGFEDGTFKPNEDMTRAEFAAIVVRGLGLKLVKGSASFSDVRANDWYNDAIHTALTYGLIDGFKDGTFQPQDKITREQAMTIIAKAMEISGLKDKLDGRDAVEIAERFQDFDTVAGWAKSGVGETIAAGIVTGRKNDTLDPKSHVTRAEVMVMIRKLLIQSELI